MADQVHLNTQRGIALTQNTTGISWDDLRVFLSVCRNASMAKAAKELGINVSTVSRRLAALEAAIDVRLVERLTIGIRATDEGLDLLKDAVELERSVDSFLRRAQARSEELSGEVRIACVSALARQLVVECRPFYQAYPKITLRLITGPRLADLTRREADIGLRFIKPEQPELIVRRLGEWGWGIYGSNDYLRDRVSSRVEDYDWIAFEAGGVEEPMKMWLNQNVPRRCWRVVVDDLTAIVGAVSAGLGVALLPAPLARLAGLSPAPLEIPLPHPGPIWLVAHSELRKIPRIKAVWDFLIEAYYDSTSRFGLET
ncbi:MAG: LysR family transcriptional regulator [Myxococcota bacterium]